MRSVSRDAYMGSDHGITLDTYFSETLCAYTTMARFVKYRFDDNPDMSATITQLTVCNSP